MRIPNACRLAIVIAVLLAYAWGTPSASTRAASSGFHMYVPLLFRGGQPSAEQQVLELVNQQRKLHGCPAMALSGQLGAAASMHSQDMAIHDLFSHSGSDGSTMVSRVVAMGYSYSLLAENLAAGSATAEDAMAGWMNSPEHRANILNCNLRELGVGFYVQMDDQSNVRLDNGQLSGPFRYYWTQDFGSPMAH
jgi:uncharacterized protein YkwD